MAIDPQAGLQNSEAPLEFQEGEPSPFLDLSEGPLSFQPHTATLTPGKLEVVRNFVEDFDINTLGRTIPSHQNLLSFLETISGPMQQQDPLAFGVALESAITNHTLSEADIFTMGGILPPFLQAILLNRVQSHTDGNYGGVGKNHEKEHHKSHLLEDILMERSLHNLLENLYHTRNVFEEELKNVFKQQDAADLTIDTALETVENLADNKVVYTIPFVEAERIVYQNEQGGYYYIGDDGNNYDVPDSALESLQDQLTEGKQFGDQNTADQEKQNRLAAQDGFDDIMDLFEQEDEVTAAQESVNERIKTVETKLGLQKGNTATTDDTIEAPTPKWSDPQAAIDANINTIANAISGNVMMSKADVLEMAAEAGIPENSFDKLISELEVRDNIKLTEQGNFVAVKSNEALTSSKMSVDKDPNAGMTSLTFGSAAASPEPIAATPAPTEPQHNTSYTNAFNPAVGI